MGKTFKRLPISLEKNDGFVTSLILAITVFFFINFFYLGVTTTPEQINESDSLAYHIPLAQSLAKGKFLAPPDLDQGLGYYPAIGESILSFFIIFGGLGNENIPLFANAHNADLCRLYADLY